MANIKLDDEKLSESAVSAKDLFQKKTLRRDTQKFKLGDSVVEVIIEALPVKKFREIQEAHPARRNNETDKLLGYNNDSFPPALFAASIKEPEMSEDEWASVWLSPNWAPGELGNLLDMVWSTSNRGFDVPFGVNG